MKKNDSGCLGCLIILGVVVALCLGIRWGVSSWQASRPKIRGLVKVRFGGKNPPVTDVGYLDGFDRPEIKCTPISGKVYSIRLKSNSPDRTRLYDDTTSLIAQITGIKPQEVEQGKWGDDYHSFVATFEDPNSACYIKVVYVAQNGNEGKRNFFPLLNKDVETKGVTVIAEDRKLAALAESERYRLKVENAL